MLNRARKDMTASAVLAAVSIIGRRGNLSHGSPSGRFFDPIGRYLAVRKVGHVPTLRTLKNGFGGRRHAELYPTADSVSPVQGHFADFRKAIDGEKR